MLAELLQLLGARNSQKEKELLARPENRYFTAKFSALLLVPSAIGFIIGAPGFVSDGSVSAMLIGIAIGFVASLVYGLRYGPRVGD